MVDLNGERILEIAKQQFTLVGANASLEDIARRAGVGPGTLYRHFPVREDLLVRFTGTIWKTWPRGGTNPGGRGAPR